MVDTGEQLILHNHRTDYVSWEVIRMSKITNNELNLSSCI